MAEEPEHIDRPLSSGVTLEALYLPDDCMEMMGDAPCHGSLTVLADGVEQFAVPVSQRSVGAPPT